MRPEMYPRDPPHWVTDPPRNSYTGVGGAGLSDLFVSDVACEKIFWGHPTLILALSIFEFTPTVDRHQIHSSCKGKAAGAQWSAQVLDGNLCASPRTELLMTDRP